MHYISHPLLQGQQDYHAIADQVKLYESTQFSFEEAAVTSVQNLQSGEQSFHRELSFVWDGHFCMHDFSPDFRLNYCNVSKDSVHWEFQAPRLPLWLPGDLSHIPHHLHMPWIGTYPLDCFSGRKGLCGDNNWVAWVKGIDLNLVTRLVPYLECTKSYCEFTAFCGSWTMLESQDNTQNKTEQANKLPLCTHSVVGVQW